MPDDKQKQQKPVKSIYQWYYDVFLNANWGLDYNNIWFVTIFPQDGDLKKFLNAVATEAARFDVESTGTDDQGIVTGYSGKTMAQMVKTAWNYNVGKIPDNCNIVGWNAGNILLPVTSVRIPKDSINTKTVEMGAGYTWVPPILADKHQQFAPLILDMYYTAYPFGEFVVRPWSMAINRFGLKARMLRCNICCTLFTKNNHYLGKGVGNNWFPKFEYRYYSCYPLGVPDLNFKTGDEDLTKTTSISFGYDFYRISIPNKAYLKPLHNPVTDVTQDEFKAGLAHITIPVGKNDDLEDVTGEGVGYIDRRLSKNPLYLIKDGIDDPAGSKIVGGGKKAPENAMPITPSPNEGMLKNGEDDASTMEQQEGERLTTVIEPKKSPHEDMLKQGKDDAIDQITGDGPMPPTAAIEITPSEHKDMIQAGMDEVVQTPFNQVNSVQVTQLRPPFFDEPIFPLFLKFPPNPDDDPFYVMSIDGRVGPDEPGRVGVGKGGIAPDEPDSVNSDMEAVGEDDEVISLDFEGNGPIEGDEAASISVAFAGADSDDEPNKAPSEILSIDVYDEPTDARAEKILADTDDEPVNADAMLVRPDNEILDVRSKLEKPEPEEIDVDSKDLNPRGDEPDRVDMRSASVDEDDSPESVDSDEQPVAEYEIKPKAKDLGKIEKDEADEVPTAGEKTIDGDEPDISFPGARAIENDEPNPSFGLSDTIANDEPSVSETPEAPVPYDEPSLVSVGEDMKIAGDEPSIQEVPNVPVSYDEPPLVPVGDGIRAVADEPSAPKTPHIPVENDEPSMVSFGGDDKISGDEPPAR